MMRAGRLVNVFKCIYMYKLFCSMKIYYLNLEGFSRNLEDRGMGKSWAHINNNFSSLAKYIEAQQLLTLHIKYSKYQQPAGITSENFQGHMPNLSSLEHQLSFTPGLQEQKTKNLVQTITGHCKDWEKMIHLYWVVKLY